jgi:hypothetical protein
VRKSPWNQRTCANGLLRRSKDESLRCRWIPREEPRYVILRIRRGHNQDYNKGISKSQWSDLVESGAPGLRQRL